MKRYWYIGVNHQDGKAYEAFYSNTPPTHDYHGHIYHAVIGPFRTKRAALWAEKYGMGNPHFRHVNDAERISKEEEFKK